MTKNYRIAAIYDTETTTLRSGVESIAFTCLYIVNDVKRVDMSCYVADETDDIRFYRREEDMIEYLDGLIKYGEENGFVPIVCAYNLMFDMQTIMSDLARKYRMSANAQSSTNVYTLDLLDDEDNQILRFWDTFNLEMRGLYAMGETCGLEKATGEWDYTLTRTPETPLTDDEMHYASRDVQVIPAYLRWLIETNEWLEASMLGCRVLTKTSLVRQMAKHDISNLRIKKANGKTLKLGYAFERLCERNLPSDWYQYAIRRACFRGGFTFTAANHANKVVDNVVSMDAVSMHHAFINGRMIPLDFYKCDPAIMQGVCESIVSTPLERVLNRYDKPFEFAFHARIKFVNVRLRNGSVFERHGIALEPQAKFKRSQSKAVDMHNERDYISDQNLRLSGWLDRAEDPIFAFGKLMSASSAVMHFTEIELYAFSLVYEWDSMEVLLGELSQKFKLPPDYVTLQSNMLYKAKDDCKQVIKHYEPGKPYAYKAPSTVPDNLREQLETGSMNLEFFESYYQSTVKGQYNGIYGTQAQDVYKADYVVVDGRLSIDPETVPTKETFAEKEITKPKVLYTYGMRIVGGSRLHLVLAMVLLDAAFGDRIKITGGDTDSMKISLSKSVAPADLVKALEPLHNAIVHAVERTMKRVKREFPRLAADFKELGTFEIEPAAADKIAFEHHMEAWNKARISLINGKSHITCAGLSRPITLPHIEDLVDDLISCGYTFEEVAPAVLGYNTYISNDVCHALQRTAPDIDETIDENVKDYLGSTHRVSAHKAIALYPVGRWLGETTKRSNHDSVIYLRSIGTEVDTSEKIIEVVDSTPNITVGDERRMKGNNGIWDTLIGIKSGAMTLT